MRRAAHAAEARVLAGPRPLRYAAARNGSQVATLEEKGQGRAEGAERAACDPLSGPRPRGEAAPSARRTRAEGRASRAPGTRRRRPARSAARVAPAGPPRE